MPESVIRENLELSDMDNSLGNVSGAKRQNLAIFPSLVSFGKGVQNLAIFPSLVSFWQGHAILIVVQ